MAAAYSGEDVVTPVHHAVPKVEAIASPVDVPSGDLSLRGGPDELIGENNPVYIIPSQECVSAFP